MGDLGCAEAGQPAYRTHSASASVDTAPAQMGTVLLRRVGFVAQHSIGSGVSANPKMLKERDEYQQVAVPLGRTDRDPWQVLTIHQHLRLGR